MWGKGRTANSVSRTCLAVIKQNRSGPRIQYYTSMYYCHINGRFPSSANVIHIHIWTRILTIQTSLLDTFQPFLYAPPILLLSTHGPDIEQCVSWAAYSTHTIHWSWFMAQIQPVSAAGWCVPWRWCRRDLIWSKWNCLLCDIRHPYEVAYLLSFRDLQPHGNPSKN